MAGFGAKLPLSFSAEDGPFTLLKTYKELVSQNIKNLVLTAPGERMMDPFFGVGLRNYLFEMAGADLHNNIKAKIVEQVQAYLPYISIENIFFLQSEDKDNTLLVEIYYFIKPLNLQDLVTINVDVN